MHLCLRYGYTLIEVLIVIGIITVLMALSFVILTGVREKSYQTICASNLRQIDMAFRLYANDYNQRYPHNGDNKPENEFLPFGPFETATTRWGFLLLQPYVKTPDVFFCPSAGRFRDAATGWKPPSFSSYCCWANYGSARPMNTQLVDDGTFIGNYVAEWVLDEPSRMVKREGVTNLLLASDIVTDSDDTFTNHGGKGGNALYNDGHVKWKPYDQMRRLETYEGHALHF